MSDSVLTTFLQLRDETRQAGLQLDASAIIQLMVVGQLVAIVDLLRGLDGTLNDLRITLLNRA
jgi:hypothetical protein